ncbi:hypothetical protein [Paenibacillus sp. FSL R7-0652]|uniref:hypothetical protein n=1 Tax=Paenibacillus sp. FSL R7-0652 TaxID=2921687 RepID=UPI003159DAFD
MMVMKYVRFMMMICIGLMCSYFIAPNTYAGSVPQDVQSFAEGEGLDQFKMMILEDPEGYGYKNEEEVKGVTLGRGFEVYLFDVNKFPNISDSLIDVSKPTAQYDFIVKSGGMGKSFLSVERYEGKFRVVLAGGDASRLDESLHVMSKALSTDISTVDPVLIKDGNIRYLAMKVDGKEVNIPDVPKEKNSLMGGMDNHQLWDSAKTIDLLKEFQAQEVDPNTDGAGGYPAIHSDKSNKDYTNIALISLIIALVGVVVLYMFLKKKENI